MPFLGVIGNVVERIPGQEGVEEAVDWRIPGFGSLGGGRGDCFSSPQFTLLDRRWLLLLWPNLEAEDLRPGSGRIGFDLFGLSGGAPETLRFSVGLRGPGGVEKRVERETGPLITSSFLPVSRSEVLDPGSGLLPDGVLTVSCVLGRPGRDSSAHTDEVRGVDIFTEERRDSTTQTDEARGVDVFIEERRGVDELLESLRGLLASGEGSDCVVEVGPERLPAHRAILQARSPVFRAMFSHNTAEKESGVVEIKDCDPESFQAFLEHLYTGGTGMISKKNVFALYASSDKYGLKVLKEACLQFIKCNLTPSCFCDAVMLALKHNEKELLDFATHFFCSNTLEILKTVEWQMFLRENSTIGNELLIQAFSK